MKRLAKEGERAAVVRRRTGSGIFSQSDSLRLEEASFDGEALLTWASPESLGGSLTRHQEAVNRPRRNQHVSQLH